MKRTIIMLVTALAMGFIALPANACQLVCLLAPPPVAPTTNDQQCNTTYPGFHFAKPGIMSSLSGDRAVLAGAQGGPNCADIPDANMKNAIDYFWWSVQGFKVGGAATPIGTGYPANWNIDHTPMPIYPSSCPGPAAGQIVCCNM